jgi:DNA-binding MarR family transcriptional regulator
VSPYRRPARTLDTHHILTRRRPTAESYRAAAALRIALRQFHASSERVTHAHGLTPERYELLLLVETGSVTVGRIAELLKIRQSAATQLAQRAEQDGLVERTVADHDGRMHPLRLTRKGKRCLAGCLAELEQERAALVSILATLAD